jgi:uncharacterized protein YbjT (DUF2867 family)
LLERMTTLILGATGKTGRRVAQRLNGRPLSRTTGFDLDDPATWAEALDGVTGVYLLEPVGKGRLPAFVDRAVAAGARRLVLLSAPAAEEQDHPLHAAEQAVRNSGVDWTILRPHWFAQNFSEDFWRPGILDGVLALPTGDGRVPFVDADDIADVAVAGLTTGGHSGRVYELTGPRALSFGEAVALIGRATGRTVRHLDIEAAVFQQRQVSYGSPPEVARLLTGIMTAVRDGSGAKVTDDVTRALARAPRSFEDFVARAAADGCWAVNAGPGPRSPGHG